MNLKTIFFTITFIAAGSFFGFAGEAHAQPTDAQIKRDISGPKTVSVTLGKPGKREWSTTYKKYMWTRNFEAKVKTNDPKVFTIVGGYAAYDIVGGRYQYWRTFTSWNRYDGIPNPTDDDVKALIAKFGPQKFLGNYYFNRVEGEIESLALADDPKFEWHTPNSVSFRVTTVYTERINDIGGKKRMKRNFEIRLYRPDTSAEWNNMISTAREYEEL